MKNFCYFLVGFMFAFFFTTFMDFEFSEALRNCNFVYLAKYIGPAVFGGLLYMVITVFGERLDKIEKDINELNKK